MSSPEPPQQTAEERFLARMAEIDAERRRVILTVLRRYHIAACWTRAATWGAVLLTVASVVQLMVGQMFWGTLGLVAGALALVYVRQQAGRIRAAQREAQGLLGGDDDPAL